MTYYAKRKRKDNNMAKKKEKLKSVGYVVTDSETDIEEALKIDGVADLDKAKRKAEECIDDGCDDVEIHEIFTKHVYDVEGGKVEFKKIIG